jgi:hypothetical protein
MMLDNLDSVPWEKLKHAYGHASDVPAQIRNLSSENKMTRVKALNGLDGSIVHQGTRYQAASHVVPFLYELISSPDTPDRNEIVELLAFIAVGYDESYLPDGIDSVALRGDYEDSISQMSPSERAKCETYGFGPRVELDCYEAVLSGASVLLRLATEDDIKLRRAAVYALAWFPEYGSHSIPVIEAILTGSVEHIDVANALLALGLLARESDDGSVSLHTWLSHDSLMVRTCAAIAMARDPQAHDVLETLIEAISSRKELNSTTGDILFNEGDLAGYASLVLGRFGAGARDRVVPALCRTLETVNPYQSLDVTQSILELIVCGRAKAIKDVPADSLDPLERDALRSIAEHGGWHFDGGVLVNYSDLVRSYGLPGSREGLLEYLKS